MKPLATTTPPSALDFLRDIRLFILDLDNTLFDENTYLEAVFCTFFATQKLEAESQAITHTLADTTRKDSKDIFRTFLEACSFGYSAAHHDLLFDLYSSLECPLALYEDASRFLTHLTQSNLPFAILTNGATPPQQNKIKNLALSHLPVFYARAEGREYEKPHSRAFLRVCEHFHTPPQQACMIGDQPATDIKGAHAFGMKSLLLRRGYGALIPCNEASGSFGSFDELIPHLALAQKQDIKAK